MLSSQSPQRLFVYFIIIGLIPLFLASYHFLSERSKINALFDQMETVEYLYHAKEQKQGTNLAIRELFLNADHFYIDKNVETIALLKAEKEALKKALNQENLVENEGAKKRLQAIEMNNKISFSEGVVQSYPYFHETIETLNRPVEVDSEDIQLVLSQIEGIEIGKHSPGPDRPQLIITDFKLDKKNTGDKNEVYLLNMKILKREFF